MGCARLKPCAGAALRPVPGAPVRGSREGGPGPRWRSPAERRQKQAVTLKKKQPAPSEIKAGNLEANPLLAAGRRGGGCGGAGGLPFSPGSPGGGLSALWEGLISKS